MKNAFLAAMAAQVSAKPAVLNLAVQDKAINTIIKNLAGSHFEKSFKDGLSIDTSSSYLSDLSIDFGDMTTEQFVNAIDVNLDNAGQQWNFELGPLDIHGSMSANL